MGKPQPNPLPDDLPRSPSGRIPQWVMDEAAGRPMPADTWRSGSSILPGEPVRSRQRLKSILALLVVGSMLAVVYLVDARGLLGPARGRDGWPSPGYEEAAQPLGFPTAVPLGGEGRFRFLSVVDGAEPVTFSPCRPIHFVVRPDHAPRGGRSMITDSIARVSAATGLTFVDDGSTDEAPAPEREFYQPERYGDRWAPVLVAWATPAEVPDFGVDILGEAGPVEVSSSAGERAYVSGAVFLDPTKIQRVRATHGEPAASAVILHELGHLLGLDHIQDRGQLMFPRARATVTTYQAGDLAGLAQVGTGPCQPDL